jgi:hypothetical protein
MATSTLRSRIAALSLSALLVLTLSQCGKSSDSPSEPNNNTPEPVAAVVLTGAPTSQIALIGQPLQLTATTNSATGVALTGRSVLWSSSNSSVAIVTTGGLVQALTTGEATITATSEGKSASVTLQSRLAIALPAAGATQPVVTTLLNGAATLSIPGGAVAAGTVLSAAPIANPLANPLLVAGTAFNFGPDGTQFTQPVTLTLRYDPTVVLEADRAGLAIYVQTGSTWTKVAASVVSSSGFTVSAPITSFSNYALLRRGPPTALSVTAGASQSATINTTLPIAPSVTVRDATGAVYAGVTVTFAVASGGGSITGATQVTNSNGVATVGSWTLGSTVGTQSLTASIAGVSALTINATATAVPVPVMSVSSSSFSLRSLTSCSLTLTRNVTVSNTGTAGSSIANIAVDVETSTGGVPEWATATLSQTTAPATLAIEIRPLGVPTGQHTKLITVTAPGVAPRTVSLTLDVNSSVAFPIITSTQNVSLLGRFPITPVTTSADVALTPGFDCPSLTSATITSLGTDLAPTTPPPWLTATLSSTTLPATLRLTANSAETTEGAYTGFAIVSAIGSNGSTYTARVNVAYSLLPTGPVLSLGTYNVAAGLANNQPPTNLVTIFYSNTGPGATADLGAITFGAPTYSPTGSNWLTAVVDGSAIVLIGDARGMAPGTYSATIRVFAAGATNSPATVSVTLTVTAGMQQ